MKLQQLMFFQEVVKQGCNISKAASSLYTSQPGISKQISQLEKELKVDLFDRHGRHLNALTPAGEKIYQLCGEVLAGVSAIQALADEETRGNAGQLSIATTHTQSRYMLPTVITRFRQKYPDVALHMHQGTPMQISQLAVEGTADFAIATEAMELFHDLVMMPCFRWNRAILVPKNHPLCQISRPSLQDIAAFPIVTYVYGFTGRSKLDEAFNAEGLEPKVVFTAVDADVIKTYVRLGLGIGIIASMAVEEERDNDLVALDASHLFEDSITKIGFRKGTYLRSFMYDFMEMFAPHLTADKVDQAAAGKTEGEVSGLFDPAEIPLK